MTESILTYQFRIKDSKHCNLLNKKASAVNFVWNYCNEISQQSAKKRRAGSNVRWVSEFDLNYLTAGVGKDLGLNSTTIQSIAKEFTTRRAQLKRSKLKWRSAKRQLGWIPLKASAIQITEDSFKYLGRKYKFWKSREIKGKLKTGSYSQDSRGRWYINLTCEVEKPEKNKSDKLIGIDLGLKTLATCSDGATISNNKITAKYAEKLATAQRARKKKQVTAIHAKIKNVRKDFLHKESTNLVKQYKQIFVGDVSSSKLAKTKMAKSVLDAGWGMFKTMLEYKAIRLGVGFKVVNEKYSTVTCSTCLNRTGPSGLSALGVREWECSKCNTKHDRDVNAAKSILLFALGHQSQLVESPCLS
jgi:IS605 OrfB family transposase